MALGGDQTMIVENFVICEFKRLSKN